MLWCYHTWNEGGIGYWRNPQKNKIRDCKIPTKSRKANSNTNLQTRAAKPRVAGDWFWNLPWVMRWEFYNPWFIFSGDSHYSIISWNLSTKGQNYAKKLRIGLSFSLVTETNQSPTVGNSRRFSNPQLFLLKYCDDLTKFFLKVKKIVKFVDIIFYINSTLL